MSLAPQHPIEKYCFTYCGDRCNCQRGHTFFGQPLDEFREWLERRAASENGCEIAAGVSQRTPL